MGNAKASNRWTSNRYRLSRSFFISKIANEVSPAAFGTELLHMSYSSFSVLYTIAYMVTHRDYSCDYNWFESNSNLSDIAI